MHKPRRQTLKPAVNPLPPHPKLSPLHETRVSPGSHFCGPGEKLGGGGTPNENPGQVFDSMEIQPERRWLQRRTSPRAVPPSHRAPPVSGAARPRRDRRPGPGDLGRAKVTAGGSPPRADAPDTASDPAIVHACSLEPGGAIAARDRWGAGGQLGPVWSTESARGIPLVSSVHRNDLN